jgi:hypothetical protein
MKFTEQGTLMMGMFGMRQMQWSCCELGCIFWIYFIVAAFHVKECSYESLEVSFRNYNLYLK